MKTTALAIALLMSGAAFAQTSTTTTTVQPDVDADVGVQPDGDLDVDADVDLETKTTTTTNHATMDHSTTHTTMSHNTMAMTGAVVQPSNANPERDARGIPVISDPAVVPAGWNGAMGTAVGGPLVDPATGETIDASDDSYPACTATVTDNCVQAYTRR